MFVHDTSGIFNLLGALNAVICNIAYSGAPTFYMPKAGRKGIEADLPNPIGSQESPQKLRGWIPKLPIQYPGLH